MRNMTLKKSAVFAMILCVFIVLFVFGVFASNVFRPSMDLPDFTDDHSYLSNEEPASPPPAPVEPKPPIETQPYSAEEPADISASPVASSREAMLMALPVRMRIPALSLDYEVRETGADENGTMQIMPALEMISWFGLSSIPGNEGNAIFGGHNSWGGVRSRLFTMDDMEIGDELEIFYADGTTLKFLLESVFVYPLNTAPAHLIMDVRGEARLTLITCKWPFNPVIGTSDNRIVATFKEESIFVIPDPPIEPYPPREPQ